MDVAAMIHMGAIGVVGALLAAGCTNSDGVTIGTAQADSPSPTAAVSVAMPASPEPASQEPVGAYPTANWWSHDLEELSTALEGCRTDSGPFREQECAFMGLLGVGTEGMFGVVVQEHEVDLVAAAYDMCRQLDHHPDLDAFREHVQPPPTWPEPGDDWPALNGDIVLTSLTVTAGQTLCPHHRQLVSSFMTPQFDG